MIRKLSILFSLVISCSTVTAYDPGIHFPKETNLLFYLKNTEILSQISEDHPVKRLLNIPAIKNKLSVLTPDDEDKKKLESELGLEAGELAKIFTQHIALGCHFTLDTIVINKVFELNKLERESAAKRDISKLNSKTAAVAGDLIKKINLILIAESKLSSESLGTLLKSLFSEDEDVDIEIFSDRVEEVPQYIVNILNKETDKSPSIKIPLGFALINNQLIAGMHPEGNYFRECLRKIKKEDGDTESLASITHYMDSQDALIDSDVFAYFDIGNLTQNLKSNYENAMMLLI